MELTTERLLLRPFRPEDRVAILNIFGDREANVYLPWFPLQTLEEAERFFEERYSRLYRQPRGYGYAVCLKGGRRSRRLCECVPGGGV